MRDTAYHISIQLICLPIKLGQCMLNKNIQSDIITENEFVFNLKFLKSF